MQGTVVLWLDWTQGEIESLRPVLESFQETFPAIEVSVAFFPSEELLQRFLTAEPEDRPTVLFGPSDWTAELADSGLVRDLTDKVEDELRARISSVALQQASLGPRIFALPISMQGVVLYRNRSLASEPAETLGDLVRTSSLLRAEGLPGATLDLQFLFTGAFIDACDSQLLTGQGDVTMTRQAALCWLDLLRKWGDEAEVSIGDDEDLELFAAGQAAWLLEGSWHADRLAEALGEDLAVDPWPGLRETGRTLRGYAWTRNAYLAASSAPEDAEASWIFLRFLLAPEFQGALSQSPEGRQVPVVSDLALESAWMRDLLSALDGNIPLPHHPNFEIVADVMQFEAEDVVQRRTEIDFSIRRLFVELEQELPESAPED